MRMPRPNNRLQSYLYAAASLLVFCFLFDIYTLPVAFALSLVGVHITSLLDSRKYMVPLFIGVYGVLICLVDHVRVRRAVMGKKPMKAEELVWEELRYKVPVVVPRVMMRKQATLPFEHPDLPENKLIASASEQMRKAAAVLQRFEEGLTRGGNLPVVALRVGRPLCPTRTEASSERKGEWVSLAVVERVPADYPWLGNHFAFVWVQAITGVDDRNIRWHLFASCWGGFAQGWRNPTDAPDDALRTTLETLKSLVVLRLVHAIHEDAADASGAEAREEAAP